MTKKVRTLGNVFVHKQSTQPTATSLGDVWVDTSTNPGTVKIVTSVSPLTYSIVGQVGGIPSSLTLTGDVSGSGTGTINTTLANSGVTPGTYAVNGNTLITVDSKGRITNAQNVIVSANPNGASGGDLTGTYPNPVLSTVNSNVGSFGSSTQSPNLNVDAKGRITSVNNVTITPAFSSITSTPTTLAGYGITDALPSSTTLNGDVNGALGSNTLSVTGVAAGTYNNVTVDNKGRVTAGINISAGVVTRTIQTVANAGNGWSVSATRSSLVNYSCTITTSGAAFTSPSGTIVLEIAPTNSSNAGDWAEIGRITNGQSISTFTSMTLTQVNTMQISGIVPPGYFVRIRRIITSGSPTFSYNSGQETLL